jgi:hypothetical protein
MKDKRSPYYNVPKTIPYQKLFVIGLPEASALRTTKTGNGMDYKALPYFSIMLKLLHQNADVQAYHTHLQYLYF